MSTNLPEIGLEETVRGRLWLATHATLVALNLPGLAADRFLMRKLLWDTGLKVFPTVITAPAAKGIDWNAGSVGTEQIEYGFGVAFIAAGNRDLSLSGCGVQFLWEEKTTERFLNDRQPEGWKNTAEVQITRTNVVPPSETFLSAAMKMNWDAQYLVIRYQVEQQRGT